VIPERKAPFSLLSLNIPASGAPPRHSSWRRNFVTQAFHIDHRHHLNLAWERQKKEEEELGRVKSSIECGNVVPVRNLQHLDLLMDAAGGRLVIVALHSCSCGVCKDLLRAFEQICSESRSQRAGIIFLSHDVINEFDYPSDVARYYAIKSVPRFLFFVDGALVRTLGMSDVRQSKVTHRSQVESAVQSEQQRIKSILWELLVKNAPSARR